MSWATSLSLRSQSRTAASPPAAARLGVGEHGADGGELGLHGREVRPEGTEERELVPDGGAKLGQHLPHDGRGESTLRHGCALECLSLSHNSLKSQWIGKSNWVDEANAVE